MSRFYVDAELEVSEDGTACKIEVMKTDGSKIEAQEILDAVADMLMHYYGVVGADIKSEAPLDS